MRRSLGNRYSPSFKCPWEWRSYSLPWDWCFFSGWWWEAGGERGGANLAMTVSLNPARQSSFSDCSFLLALGASHLQRFFLIYRLVGRVKRTIFSTAPLWLASLWEHRTVHLSGFSARCLSAFLAVSVTGCLSCLVCLDWWEAAVESASLLCTVANSRWQYVCKAYVLTAIPHSDLPLFLLSFIATGFRRNWLTSP